MSTESKEKKPTPQQKNAITSFLTAKKKEFTSGSHEYNLYEKMIEAIEGKKIEFTDNEQKLMSHPRISSDIFLFLDDNKDYEKEFPDNIKKILETPWKKYHYLKESFKYIKDKGSLLHSNNLYTKLGNHTTKDPSHSELFSSISAGRSRVRVCLESKYDPNNKTGLKDIYFATFSRNSETFKLVDEKLLPGNLRFLHPNNSSELRSLLAYEYIEKADFKKAGFSEQRKEYLLSLFARKNNESEYKDLTSDQRHKLIGTLYAQYKSIKEVDNPLSHALEEALSLLLNIGIEEFYEAKYSNSRKEVSFWDSVFGPKKTKSADPVFKLITLEIHKDKNKDIKNYANKVNQSAMAIMVFESTPTKNEKDEKFDLFEKEMELEETNHHDSKLKAMLEFGHGMVDYIKAHSTQSLFHSRQKRAEYFYERITNIIDEYNKSGEKEKNIVCNKLIVELLIHHNAIIIANNGKESELSKKLKIALTNLLELKKDCKINEIKAKVSEICDINQFSVNMIEITKKEQHAFSNKSSLKKDFQEIGEAIDKDKKFSTVSSQRKRPMLPVPKPTAETLTDKSNPPKSTPPNCPKKTIPWGAKVIVVPSSRSNRNK